MSEEDFWLIAYVTALHAMLPRDAPPGLITTPFNENAKGVADDAAGHFREMRARAATEKGENPSS